MIDPAFLGRREIATSDDMEHLGLVIGEQLEPGDLLVLTGPLGAGKTTFTRGLAEGLGVRGPVQSPTFVIARTHPSPRCVACRPVPESPTVTTIGRTTTRPSP